MKKSILFGALAFFAISAMGIQNATAQEVDAKAKKAESKAVAVEKKDAPSATTVRQEPVKEKKADCCAEKKAECKKADAKKADCCADKKVAKDDAKTVKSEAKPKIEKQPLKPSPKKDVKKAHKTRKADK